MDNMLYYIIVAVFFVMTVVMAFVQLRDFNETRKTGKLEQDTSAAKCGAAGFVCLFFDVLGIGCFSTLTFLMKAFGLVKDSDIPGTLNVSTALSAPIFALLFFTKTDVDPMTLIVLTAAAAVGAYFGAKVVSGLSEVKVQLGMGLAMLVVAFFVLMGQLDLLPVGGDLTGLGGIKLIVAAAVLVLIGALANLGVGPWAPTMALLFMLGMQPLVCYPIMYAISALQQPISSMKFIHEHSYNVKASLAITVCGIISAFLAFLVTVSIPVYALKWVVFVIVLYTGLRMFLSYRSSRAQASVGETALQ